MVDSHAADKKGGDSGHGASDHEASAAWRSLAVAGYGLTAAGYALEGLEGARDGARDGGGGVPTHYLGAAAYALVAAGKSSVGGKALSKALKWSGRAALLAFAVLVLLLRADAVAALAAAGQFLMLQGRVVPGAAVLLAYYTCRVQEHAAKVGSQLGAGEAALTDGVMTAGHAALGLTYARELQLALDE